MKDLVKYFVLILFAFLLWQCANQQAPPGGPKDTTPPEIINTFPEDGTLNFNEKYFEIDFSEYVDKLSLLDALFISPEINNLDYDWTGTSVQITFDDTLDENTTYTVSIGSGIKDLNNQNPMLNALNISFSTGDKIDIGKINGKVYGNELNGTMIFAYHKVDTFANPLVFKPSNLTQVGEKGDYQILGLKNGEYRLIAVKDANGNRIYNIGEDNFGILSKNIFISDSIKSIADINFRMTIEDTIAPFISSVTMTDNYHISVEFSEPIDSSAVSAENFYVIDSTENKTVKGKYLFSGNKRKSEYILAIADTLIAENSNYVVTENIVDKYLNVNSYEVYEFVVSTKKDTLIPEIKSISSPFADKRIDFLKPSFTINFNDGVSETDFSSSLIMPKYRWNYIKENDASFIINILEEIEPNKEIEFEINRNALIDVAGNSLDSLQKFTLKTITGKEFSGLSGKVKCNESISNLRVVINNVETKNLEYSTSVDENYNYKFDRILPGRYKLWMFEDSDENKKYNHGKVEPFELAEHFNVYQDTLNLRARWPVGDVMLNFSK